MIETEVRTRAREERRARQARRRRQVRIRRLVLLLVLLLLVPLYSWTNMALQPSSLPLGVRSVDWVRAHHGGWLVNFVEQKYYAAKQAKPGGPGLKTLPVVGKTVTPALSSFRPPRLVPILRPALRGEGVWHAVTPAVQGAPPLYVTTFRPEPSYPRVVAYVAWLDHTRTQIALYPGRYDPPASPAARGPMQVPWGQRWRLLATFNSGFAYRDVREGFVVNGHVYGALQPGLATLLVDRSGRVDIRAWHGGPAPGPGIVVARQNLPLIVDRGRPNPSLSDGAAWGKTIHNATRVWRTGVGVDRNGNLIYAAADAQTVRTLATILIHAGAVRAMEMDINPEWPTFNTYARGGGRSPTMFVPNYQQSATRYLVPDDRDFFAVYRRVPGVSRVPFR